MAGKTWIDSQDSGKVTALMARARESGHFDAVAEYAEGDDNVALWLSFVNAHLTRMVGATMGDLTDWSWREAYDSGMAPKRAAVEALKADDLYAALIG